MSLLARVKKLDLHLGVMRRDWRVRSMGGCVHSHSGKHLAAAWKIDPGGQELEAMRTVELVRGRR